MKIMHYREQKKFPFRFESVKCDIEKEEVQDQVEREI